MQSLDPRASFAAGITLLRERRPVEALPHLERAVADADILYAKPALKYARALADGVTTVHVSYDGRKLQFLLEPGNMGLDLHHVGGEFFEIAELQHCSQIIPRRSVIVDVGANTGNHTIFFSAFLEPRLLIPIEPVPEAVSVLRRNLDLNGLIVDERGMGLAAGSSEGLVHLDVKSNGDLVVAQTKAAMPGGTTGVRCAPLDELVPERVDFLKIDVEGYEAEVLLGADRILREDKPTLMLEANDASRESLLSTLSRYGYRQDRAYQGFRYHNLFLSVR